MHFNNINILLVGDLNFRNKDKQRKYCKLLHPQSNLWVNIFFIRTTSFIIITCFHFNSLYIITYLVFKECKQNTFVVNCVMRLYLFV